MRIAVIFAGGRSSRMQRDKALLPFAGYSTLSEYQYRRLSKIFDHVYISSKSNKFDFDIEVIKDKYKESSPLVALVSIFEHLEVKEVFVLSVDSPFVDLSTIDNLYANALEGEDIVVARSPHGVEPLCAIYRRTILPIAKEFLESNNHRLKSLLSNAKTQYIEFDSSDIFLNLNYPEDYKRAIFSHPPTSEPS